MRIVIASGHAGYELKELVALVLRLATRGARRSEQAAVVSSIAAF